MIFCIKDIIDTSHFKKERFAPNFLTPQNPSKAIFMEKENPRSFFHFSFQATLSFTLQMPWSMPTYFGVWGSAQVHF